MGKSQSAHSYPLPIKDQTELFEDEERAIGKKGQNGSCPLESEVLQVKPKNRQTGNGNEIRRGVTELGSYTYVDE
jgi:hypothetical protein